MPEITVDIEVKCNKCGKDLSYEAEAEGPSCYTNNHSHKITIEPCEDCRQVSYETGFDEGKEEGNKEGKEEGRKEAIAEVKEEKKEGGESGN